jgi:hypothetical protein
MALKKNLIYFCYFKNVDEIDLPTKLGILCLEHYRGIFDGQKIIFISGDNLTDEFRKKSLEFFSFLEDFEYFFVQNNSETRESEYFIESIKKISSLDTLTFYAHNKGSTHDIRMDGLDIWIVSMFYFNLGQCFIDEVVHNLTKNYTFAGIYKKIYEFFNATWHYSGAFFWFNTAKLVNKDNWGIIEKGRMGLESYPGRICTSEESFSSLVSIEGDFSMNKSNLLDVLTSSLIDLEELNQFEKFLYKIKNNL